MVPQSDNTFHTVIIGAGPGGLACATELAREGMEVLLLERNPEVGPKVCAGGIPWSGLNRRLPAELFESSFRRQHIFSNWQRLAIDSPNPIISTVDRRKLGQWMLAQAHAAGVIVKTGIRAIAIDGQSLVTTGGNFGFRFLVGADGSCSLVRRALGLPSSQVGTGINYQLSNELDRMEWHLDWNRFQNGYAWIFPHRRTASVGVYASRSGTNPHTLLLALHAWARERKIDLTGCRPRAALINFDYRGWRFGSKFLVGDAAGLASALTGEGIYPAILSGEVVARTIIDPDYHSPELERLIRKQLLHRRILHLHQAGFARFSMEAFVFAIRLGLIHFDAVKMSD